MQILKLKEALQRTSPGVLTSDLEIFIENLNKIFNIKLSNTTGPFLAGGSVRRSIDGMTLNDKFQDIDFDLFFSSEKQYQQIKEIFNGLLQNKNAPAADFWEFKEEKDGSLVKESVSVEHEKSTDDVDNFLVRISRENEPVLMYRIQLIKKLFFKDAADLIDFFDFTICQFVTDGEDLLCGDFSLWDLARKRLVINKITYPVSSMRRLIKYTKQGFYACNGTMSTFLEKVIEKPSMLETRFQYVD